MRTVFDRVELHFTKSGKCQACGTLATRSTKIWHTVNPFNRDPDTGLPRTRDQVRARVVAEGQEWKATPLYHSACEP